MNLLIAVTNIYDILITWILRRKTMKLDSVLRTEYILCNAFLLIRKTNHETYKHYNVYDCLTNSNFLVRITFQVRRTINFYSFITLLY
jgi:hypothetical protein